MSPFSYLSVASLLLLSSTTFSSFAHAQQDNNKTSAPTAPQAATFFLTDTDTQFSLNLANDSNQDISIYFTSPAYSWVGVGFGESMKNSLMFIMYPSKSGNNVTLSPRISSSNAEPVVKDDVQLELLPGTGVSDEMMTVKAICRNCRVWSHGWIDEKSTAHPMIYAFGPGNRLQSNSLNAPLKRHIRYGRFTMDMVAATGASGVPEPSAALNGVSLEEGMTKDHDRANRAHAIMGCLAIFILWPLNIFAAGFIKRIGVHVGLSVFIVIFLVASYALGIATSSEYNRSKSHTSPHQILAYISLLPILLLTLLPLPPLRNLTPHIPSLHAPLVPITFTILVLTGGLGLHLSSQTTPIILAYVAITLVIFVLTATLSACIRRRGGSAYTRTLARSSPSTRTSNSNSSRGSGKSRWYSKSRSPSAGSSYDDDDEQNLVLKQYYYANGGRMGGSSASVFTPNSAPSSSHSAQTAAAPAYTAANYNNLYPGTAVGMHGRSGSAGSGVYGGGSMPGPQYLLNMHPGVPVGGRYGC
ncbi:iron reductase domain protein [Aaosphaeria arxii CBS 175.79]|uniref:Iron reductase domain protein n=1 Tax=Aaosphaeria arxii CBS 175.79 TaxID=1450172 RepID=A0A6A5XPD3_9PLEO|nr:iron reductase domain protein [Aaosphaeria arxii CBS 175.79]KAF2014590.1 iron reductase domain protein [Aaosphaeria arxii CBS 175.79]